MGSLNPVTTYEQGSSAGGITARSGDTLQGLAQQLWGDSGLWYKLAEANGLSGAEPLVEGQTLRIPSGVMRNTFNAASTTPYDPAAAIGDVTPSSAKPPKRLKCALLKHVIVMVVQFFATRFLGAIPGNVITQFTAMALGLQEEFDWKSLGVAIVTASITGGPASTGNMAVDFLINAAQNAMVQGVSMALGLQDKFNWGAVAAAGVGASLGNKLGVESLVQTPTMANLGNNLAVNSAAAIANAAVNTLVEGTDFGDNLKATLPSAIGTTLVQFAIGSVAQSMRAADAKRMEAMEVERISQALDRAQANGPGGGIQIQPGPDLTPIHPDVLAAAGQLAITPPPALAAPPALLPVVLTNAQKVALVQAAIQGSVERLDQASKSQNITSNESQDISLAVSALKRGDTRIRAARIGSFDTAGTATIERGIGRIRVNINNPNLFNSDGTINIIELDRTLVHEGRHVHDLRRPAWLRDGANTMARSRETERNAYRTEAAYLKAVGVTGYATDGRNGNRIQLTAATANYAAETSVRSWVDSAERNAKKENRELPALNAQIDQWNRGTMAYNEARRGEPGFRPIPLKPREQPVPIPVYTPPASY